MTDFTSNAPRRTAKRGTEYHVYFALLFILAIPFATVFWLADVFQKQTLFLHGPLARAWAEADRITPLIFSA
ncbi:protein pufQ [Thalassococcus sp. CAU 1522]|uniref:Protein pufQ n=1 Tax=Thalassococcus arenae TaxID=2851652 RepID=A0ABS6N5U7_9RHOB|nr:cytochrome PufQ [Thalassococcus arenae]MBV2359384.1 protein pufQ [Thalassococcus arenae]